MLYVVKYLNCVVNGVLLVEDNKLKDCKVLKFVDCVFLFYLILSLLFMLEVVLL